MVTMDQGDATGSLAPAGGALSAPLRRAPRRLFLGALWMRGAAIAAAAILSHLIGLWNGFAWDDIYYVAGNVGIQSWSHVAEHFVAPDLHLKGLDTQAWRPLRNIAYTLDYAIFGDKAWGFHLSNILIHAACSVLVLLLAQRLTRSSTAGLVAGAVFAVHPVLTEAVAWIKGRDDLLAALFGLAACLCFVVILERPNKRTWLDIVFLGLFVLALLAKEAAIALAPTFVLLALWRKALPVRLPGVEGASGNVASPDSAEGAATAIEGRQAARRIWTLCALGVALAVLYVFARTAVLGRVSQTGWITGSLKSTYLTIPHVMAYYLLLACFPVWLVCDYSHFPVHHDFGDPMVVGFILWFVLLGALLLRYGRRAPVAVFGVLWFFLNLLPVSNLVPTMQLLAERFLYLPMAGLCVAAGVMVAAWDLRPCDRTWRSSRRSRIRRYCSPRCPRCDGRGILRAGGAASARRAPGLE